MNIFRSKFLATAALAGLLIVGPLEAAAAPSQGPSHAVPHHSVARAGMPTRAADGRFFQGHGGALLGPFALQGGTYDITVWANYNALYDAGNTGTCFFTAYLNGLEQPRFVNLGTAVPVLASSPYNATLPIKFSAGHYKIIVSPVSDCDWSMTILRRGPSVPAIEIEAVQSYLVRGTAFAPTTVVHMGQSIDFWVFYRLVGGVHGTPSGTITFQEHTGPAQSAPLVAGKDANGMKQMGANAVFSRKMHDTPGPAVARFTITIGTLHVSQSLHFTLVD
jgi:hypothetical protein